jgi:hypothetical protein
MKVAALVVLSVLVALPAEAAQSRQNSVSPSCDNDGRCTTLNAVSSASSKTSRFRARHSSHQAVDANGNGIMVTVADLRFRTKHVKRDGAGHGL